MKNQFYVNLIICGMSLTFSGCAWFGFVGSSQSSNSNTKVRLPKTTQTQIPGGNTSNWRYIGTTTSGELIDEINDQSITATAESGIYSYSDRKTISDPSKFQYADQLRYKYILSNWLMDCNNQQYILNLSTLYNESGTMLRQIDYSKNNSVKWLQFGDGSIAQMQYNYICLNQNRNLGY